MAQFPAVRAEDRPLFARILTADEPRRARTPFVLAICAGWLGAAWVMAEQPLLPMVAGITFFFFAASVAHAAVWHGRRRAILLVATVLTGGWCVEYLGLTLGFPFGRYAYTDQLGTTFFGVPLLVPLAWTMIAYPSMVLARRITTHPVLGPIAGGLALGAWDVLLDPLMVDQGYWIWASSGFSLAGVPITNFFGWFATGTVFSALLWPSGAGSNQLSQSDDRVPLGLYFGSAWLLMAKCLANDLLMVGIVGLVCIAPLAWLGWMAPGRAGRVIQVRHRRGRLATVVSRSPVTEVPS